MADPGKDAFGEFFSVGHVGFIGVTAGPLRLFGEIL
jgi:hypothetical protein